MFCKLYTLDFEGRFIKDSRLELHIRSINKTKLKIAQMGTGITFFSMRLN